MKQGEKVMKSAAAAARITAGCAGVIKMKMFDYATRMVSTADSIKRLCDGSVKTAR